MKQTTSVRNKPLLPAAKLFFVLCLSLTITATTAFAGKSYPVNDEVKETFKKEFPGAEVISWDDAGDFVKAIFLLNGYRSEAYFDSEGQLHATARNLFFTQLPLAVTKTVSKRYLNADILEATEISTTDGTSYLIRLETSAKKYKVRLDAAGNISSSEKTKK
ncbi:MAG: hypothetical protein ACT4OJ_07815 [Bacteroidota bacterium]